MAQVKLNKSSLSIERKNLKNFKQFLPSLDMKRRKLLMEKNKADAEFDEIETMLAKKSKLLSVNFSMIAGNEFDLENFVTIRSKGIGFENIVGVTLPHITQIDFAVKDYDLFNTPHWLDAFIVELKEMITLKIRYDIAIERIQCLNKSLQIVTQRKNLFEKVLIPKTINTIRTIQIFLADNERAAVVRSKIAKKKRQIA